ncbi:tomoregulin-2 [Pelobates cultripes]|uniref:Tomoregulin-2 n=1 Tax=Pelobates cultripes TaxID=61616 RepID=A0AAD1SNH8_PELCU|nr:tomoregulin-2 [Pelobates cultripes]
MVVVEPHRPGWTLCDCLCSLLLPSLLLIIARPGKLAAFPTSLSDCQTPTGWNCSGFDDRENDLFLCDTNTCKFDGECLRIGDTVTCDCQFKCPHDYTPVCGSNGVTFQNECYLRGAACKQQSEILIISEGSCVSEGGSGSGDGANEGSGETSQKETSTCDICQFGAECDEDAEDVWCVCNIDCSHISFNPVCASDGKSYDNPCQIKEASCQKQEKIEVKYLGRCQDTYIFTTLPGRVRDNSHYSNINHISVIDVVKVHDCSRALIVKVVDFHFPLGCDISQRVSISGKRASGVGMAPWYCPSDIINFASHKHILYKHIVYKVMVYKVMINQACYQGTLRHPRHGIQRRFEFISLKEEMLFIVTSDSRASTLKTASMAQCSVYVIDNVYQYVNSVHSTLHTVISTATQVLAELSSMEFRFVRVKIKQRYTIWHKSHHRVSQ